MSRKKLIITETKVVKNECTMTAEFERPELISIYTDNTGMTVNVVAKKIELSVFYEFYPEDGEDAENAIKECKKSITRAYKEILKEGLPKDC